MVYILLMYPQHCEEEEETTTSYLDIIWTNETIDYWANVSPIPPSDPNDEKAQRKYEEAYYLKEMATLRQLKCVPKAHIFKVEDLVNVTLIPNQKVVLKRCIRQRSYCLGGAKCMPSKYGSKLIGVLLKNQVIGIYVTEHKECSCYF